MAGDRLAWSGLGNDKPPLIGYTGVSLTRLHCVEAQQLTLAHLLTCYRNVS